MGVVFDFLELFFNFVANVIVMRGRYWTQRKTSEADVARTIPVRNRRNTASVSLFPVPSTFPRFPRLPLIPRLHLIPRPFSDVTTKDTIDGIEGIEGSPCHYCWAVRFVGATDISHRPVYFSDGVDAAVMDGRSRRLVGDERTRTRTRRKLVVYEAGLGARRTAQHLAEVWGDHFDTERLHLSSLRRACRTSSVDLLVVCADGDTRLYPAYEDCCDEIRRALNREFA